jgi:hypothetical protein
MRTLLIMLNSFIRFAFHQFISLKVGFDRQVCWLREGWRQVPRKAPCENC